MFDIKHTSQMVRVISSLNLWRTIFHTSTHSPNHEGLYSLFTFSVWSGSVVHPLPHVKLLIQCPPSHGTLSLHSLSLTQKVEKRFPKNSRHCFLVFSILPCRSVCTQWSLPPGLKGYLLRLLLLYSIHLIKI